MESGKETITLLHARRTHKIALEDTIEKLQLKIEEATQVPPSGQTLLQGGRKIKTDVVDADPASVGLKGQSKVMLIGRVPNNPTQSLLRSLRAEAEEASAALADVEEAVARHRRGFLDRGKRTEALRRDATGVVGVEERCMRVLEKVDEVHGCRPERRTVVQRVQEVLARVDAAKEEIERVEKDEFGSVEAGRER